MQQSSQGSYASPAGIRMASLTGSEITPLLLLLCAAAILAGLLLSVFVPPTYVFGVMALIFGVVSVLVRWPYGALLAMVIASLMPRITIGLGGWNVRPEHYVVGLVSLVLCVRWLKGERSQIRWNGADKLLIAYVAWNYITSALMSPDPKMTLRWALLTNLVILPYWLVRYLVSDERTLRWMFKVFVVVGITESAYAVISFISQRLFGTSFGVEVGQYGAFGGTYGTQVEANLLGSYAGCLAIILLVLYFSSDRRPAWLFGGIVLATAALIVSLARAALISFAFVSIVLLFLGVRRGFVRPGKLLLPGLALALFLLPIAVSGGGNFTERFTDLSEQGIEDKTTMGRIMTLSAAIQDIPRHPLFGTGAGSFALTLQDERVLSILGEFRPWIGNTVIRILHDTGMLGLILFGLVAVSIAKQAKRAIAYGAYRTEIIALLAGCLIYAIAFMSADGTILAFFWVHLGILASAVVLMNNDGLNVVTQGER
jgi:O-antigen ligase